MRKLIVVFIPFVTLVCSAINTWAQRPERPRPEQRVFDNGDGNSMSYSLWLPPEVEEPAEGFPVIVWLHGSGGHSGSVPSGIIGATGTERFAAFVVSPQGPSPNELIGRSTWSPCHNPSRTRDGFRVEGCAAETTDSMQSVLSILEALHAEFSIDAARRFVTGYSAGSVGSFDVITKHPGVFSAAVPISGGFDPDVVSNDGNARVWTLHGHQDNHHPYWSRSSTQKIVELGGTGIHLEPPGDHGAPFRDAFFTDRDNELYPWLFEGIEPPLAQLIYNPSNGNVRIEAEKAPGGMISKMNLEVHPRISFFPPANTEINGDELTLFNRGFRYRANHGDGFGGMLDLGNIFPPGMDYHELHDNLTAFQYDSPASNSRDRTFRLMISSDPIRGDFDANGVVDIADIDLLANAIRTNDSDPRYDVDGSTELGHEDLAYLVTTVIDTWFGDSNLDGEFNSGDLVSVFVAGEYEDAIDGNSTWSTGDWNGDGEFTARDLVLAFEDGGYEIGPRIAVQAVPEPSSLILIAIAMFGLVGIRNLQSRSI